jgi:hypothetical protein
VDVWSPAASTATTLRLVPCYRCARVEVPRAPDGAPSECDACRALIRETRERDDRNRGG